jgi:hypothetical protein
VSLSPGVEGLGPVGFVTFGGSVPLTLAPGGNYNFSISGTSVGNDFVQGTAGVAVSSTSGSPFHITLTSPNLFPFINNFDPNSPFSLSILNSNAMIMGFSADKFVVDSSYFDSITNGGSFSVALGDGPGGSNSSLNLNFTPVPEPSAFVLMALGLGVLVRPGSRRRR